MPKREHLRRLENIWIKQPIYFLTICTDQGQKILAATNPADVLIESWHAAAQVHGWVVGRYVIMPDHAHFFATPAPESKSLSAFIRDWKKWTTRKLHDAGIVAPTVTRRSGITSGKTRFAPASPRRPKPGLIPVKSRGFISALLSGHVPTRLLWGGVADPASVCRLQEQITK